MCKCNEEVKIKLSRENDRCIIPSKTNENAGYDIYADPTQKIIIMEPFETVAVSTGIRSVIPEDYYAQIQERGSTGIKAMKYGAGVIDSSYRGVWNIVLTNCSLNMIVIYDDKLMTEEDVMGMIEEVAKEQKLDSHEDLLKEHTILYPMSKAIAQFVLLPVPKVNIEEIITEELLSYETERMEGKFGSSGK